MIRLYLDFDGTITTRDTGDGLFREFGEYDYWSNRLMSGELNVREYYRGVCSSLRDGLTSDDVERWAVEQPLDAGLQHLLRTCAQHGVQVFVVSDGFDSYIAPLLDTLPKESRRTILQVFSNTLDIPTKTPAFPGATESCTCFCASCKRNVLITTGDMEDMVVYVGDGHSDVCAAQHSDVVFAKHHLAAWMTEHRLPHHPWRSLHDVAILLARHCTQGLWHKRRGAALARKNAIEAE